MEEDKLATVLAITTWPLVVSGNCTFS